MQLIVPCAAVQQIVAGFGDGKGVVAEQQIIARAAHEDVIAPTALQFIVAGPAVQYVVAVH